MRTLASQKGVAKRAFSGTISSFNKDSRYLSYITKEVNSIKIEIFNFIYCPCSLTLLRNIRLLGIAAINQT